MSVEASNGNQSYTIFCCKFCNKIFREAEQLISHKREQHFEALLKEHCEKLIAEGKPVPEEYQQKLKELEKKTDEDTSAGEEEESQAPSEKSDRDHSDGGIQDGEDKSESSAPAAEDERDAEESQSDGSSDSGEVTGRRDGGVCGLLRRSSRRLQGSRPATRRRKAESDDDYELDSDDEIEAKDKRSLRTPSKRPNYKVPDESDVSDESDKPLMKKLEKRASHNINTKKEKMSDSCRLNKTAKTVRRLEKTTEEKLNPEAERSRQLRARYCNNNNKGTGERTGTNEKYIKETEEDQSPRREPICDETDTTFDINGIQGKSQLRTSEMAVQTQLSLEARSIQTEVNTRTVSTKICSYVANWNKDLGVQVNPACANQGSQASRDTSEKGTFMDSNEIRKNLKDCCSETDRLEVVDAAVDPVDFGTSTHVACGGDQAMKLYSDAECDAVSPEVNSIGCGTDGPNCTEAACGEDEALTYMVDAQCDAANMPSVLSVACGSDKALSDRHQVDRATSPAPTVMCTEVGIQTDEMINPVIQDKTENTEIGQQTEPASHLVQPRRLFTQHLPRQHVSGQNCIDPIFNDILTTIEQDMKPSFKGFGSPGSLFPSLPPIQLFETSTRRNSISKDEYECWDCNAPAMKTIYDLDQHLKQIHRLYSLKIFGCYKCKNSFANPDSLKSHLEKAHMLVGLDVQKGMKHFKANCEACHKRLNYKRYIEHIRRVHMSESTVEAPQPKFEFGCDTCSEAFATNEGLLKHVTNHSRSRTRLGCEKCTKTFACQEGLQCHTAVDHHVPAPPKKRLRRMFDASPSSAATSNADLVCTPVFSFSAKSDSHDEKATIARKIKLEPSDMCSSSNPIRRKAKQAQGIPIPAVATIKVPKTPTRLSPRRRSISATSTISTTPSVNPTTPSKSPRTPCRQLPATFRKNQSLTQPTSEVDATSIKSEGTESQCATTPKRKPYFSDDSSASASPTKKRKAHFGPRSSDRLARAVKSLRRKCSSKVKESQ